MNPVVSIIGPTASGKSHLALRLAQRFNGEIVSADSRQVYRYMDIGTAKPSRLEMSLVPHHMIDIINPNEDFSLAQYQQLAYRAINDIQQRHKIPLLVGGTGQYLWAVVEGWVIPAVTPDLEFRQVLESRVVRGGGEQLYQELAQVDPANCPGNRKHVRNSKVDNAAAHLLENFSGRPDAHADLDLGPGLSVGSKHGWQPDMRERGMRRENDLSPLFGRDFTNVAQSKLQVIERPPRDANELFA